MASWLTGIDVLLWIAAITQLLLVLLGAIVSLQEEWAKRHKVMVLCFFAALGIGGLWATIAQAAKSARETTEASGKLGTALTNLGTSTTEIARMTTLNTQLQGKLLDASGTITSLARENIAYMTGGDSFCYVNFSPYSANGNIELWLHERGKHHLQNVSIRVVDLEETELMRKGAYTASLKDKYEETFSIPFLARGTSRGPLNHYPLPPNVTTKSYNVFVMAPNGIFTESFRLKQVGRNLA
jgi:hypothetical protein